MTTDGDEFEGRAIDEAVTDRPHTNGDTERRDSNTDSNAESSILATPVASRRPSTASFTFASPKQTNPSSVVTKGMLQEIPPTPQAQGDTSSEYDEEPPRPSSSHSSMRPGVSLRIRDRHRTNSRSGTSSDSDGLHDRFMTDATNGEILLSPSASRSSLGSNRTAGVKSRSKTMESDGDPIRLSAFRNAVGFDTVLH